MSNSFQIRCDLLAMAKDVLMQEWQAKVKSLEDSYQQEIARRAITESNYEISYPEMSPAPTADGIINMATKLNTWVSAQSPGEYRKLKAALERADSSSPDENQAVSTAIKPRYILTIKANSSSSIAPGKWEKIAKTREEAMKIAYNWCESTRQAVEAAGPGNLPKWYINPDTLDAQWNHDNIFFSIRDIGSLI